MASGTLYTYAGSFRTNKIQIAAAYSGANVTVDPNFEYGKTNTSAEFLKKFPLGKVPAFESNGTYLNESDAIAQFVSNDALLGGNNAASQAAVREYISFSENEIIPSACTWVYPTLGFKQYNKQDTEMAQKHLIKCLNKLNNDLLTKTFLVGERVTLADITLCTSLVMLYVQVFDEKFRAPFGNVNRWFVTCVNQPNFKKILGEITLCTKMATFDNKKYQELHPKAGKQKKEQKPKEEKPKAKKVEAPAAVEEPPKPKKVDYFANVPASSFVMDEWKKVYSNDKDGYKKWFVDNYDKNALSVWHCNMQMDDSVKQSMKMSFLAANALGGYIQRIEGLRKHLFGVLMTVPENVTNGSPEYYSASGCWIQRGQDLVFRLNDDWNTDAEYYDFRKLDMDKEEDRNVLFNYLEYKDEQGRECQSYKEFK